MRSNVSLFPVIGALVTPALVVVTQPSVALTGAQVNQVAEQVTVFIRGVNNADNFGSGVLIRRQGNLYQVLTAAHVVELSDGYTVTTVDNLQHKILERKKLPNIDLALVTFKSSESYKTGKIGDSAQLTPTARVFVAGFPKPGFNIPVPTYTITDGNITTILNRSMRDGYGLAYTNPTRVGMSGGPVLNDEAQIIGIHGRKEGEADGSHTAGAWLNLGIPINLYQERFIGGGSLTGASMPEPQKTVTPSVAPPQPVKPLNLALLPLRPQKSTGSALSDPKIKQYCQNPDQRSNCRTVVVLTPDNQALNESTAISSEDYLAKGNRAYEIKDYEAAIAHYSQVLALSPQDEVALHNRAVAYYVAQQPREALKDFRLALQSFKAANDQTQVRRLTTVIQHLEQQLLQ